MSILGHYHKNKIGKLISWGGDHTVYEYGNNQVIKFSLIELLMGKYGRAKIERDYEVCRKFFGKYVLETEFKISQNGKWIAAIQNKVVGRYLVKKDLENEVVLSQFKEIMNSYRLLVESGNAKIDLVGRGGVFKSCMSNIFVTPKNDLVIIDATLLEHKNTGIFKPLFLFVCFLANCRNNYTIRKFTI